MDRGCNDLGSRPWSGPACSRLAWPSRSSDVVKRVQQSQSQRAGLVRSIGARLRVQGLRRSTAFTSTVDSRHARLFVALAGCGGEIVEACDLLRAQLDSVGCRVLLDAGDAF